MYFYIIHNHSLVTGLLEDVTYVLLISIRFESSGSGFRLRTVDCTVRIPAPYSGLHCTNSGSVQWIALYEFRLRTVDCTVRIPAPYQS